MHTQKLIHVFRDLMALIEEEATHNPVFAEKLEKIALNTPSGKNKTSQKRRGNTAIRETPDVIDILQNKGEIEYRFWLRSLDILTLKSIVKQNGFDPAKASQRWTDPDKFVALIVEQSNARLRRGSSFLPNKTPDTL